MYLKWKTPESILYKMYSDLQNELRMYSECFLYCDTF